MAVKNVTCCILRPSKRATSKNIDWTLKSKFGISETRRLFTKDDINKSCLFYAIKTPKKIEHDTLHIKYTMILQIYFNVLNNVGLIFSYFINNLASTSSMKRDKGKLF